MDIATIDQQYQQLETQAQQTAQNLTALAGKLQEAAKGGNQDAREWLLDLREIALAMQAEQNQVGALLQALHGFVANQGQAVAAPAQQMPAQTWAPTAAAPPQGYPPQGGYPQGGYPQGGYPQAGGFAQQGGGVGGMLGNFLNSGFGRAIEMGAGFGIGNDLINKIF
ncbi:MAG: hypothetical protein KGI51_00685 [Rhodospirillales bacterium]|nr:hypothetical protein [Rhodospirillales bacterium]